jgi:aldehyde dehydrogenase (NAD(P)+)
VDLVQAGLGRAPVRRAWYPGAEQRWRQFTEGRAHVRLVGAAREGELPFALIPDVDASQAGDRVFRQEPWCTVLSETALPGTDDPVAFLEKVVPFLNERVWGTLCATLVIHPKVLKDPAVHAAVERAIRELRYGTVALNTWPAAVFALASLPWGGHPSSTPQDIQSGRGWVHNTYMFEGLEKSVIRAPLVALPPLPWVPGHRSVLPLARRLVEFELGPSWLKVPGIAATALRG